MIPIKIVGKRYSIKAISELTTSEFIEMSAIEGLDTVKYIAWQTKQPLEQSFFAVTSKAVELAIGQVYDITKLPRPKCFDYSKLIDTVGQRHQIENSGKTGFPLLVWCLAVSQARSNNSDEVTALETEYMARPFAEILPAGFFFLQELQAWQRKRAESFKFANLFDKYAEDKKEAGVERLNQYSNYLEIQTLCELLNCDYEKVLESNDTFCTKILLSNLEKSTFESKFQELMSKKKAKK